jgi:hypothetical protein
MIHSVKDLSPDQKLAIENLLGRTIAENEHIRIQAEAPPPSPERPHRHISEVIRDNTTDMRPELAQQTGPVRPNDWQPESRPIWEVILDNMKDVPPEEFANLPKDGASEHDHYLYGHPKRNQ